MHTFKSSQIVSIYFVIGQNTLQSVRPTNLAIGHCIPILVRLFWILNFSHHIDTRHQMSTNEENWTKSINPKRNKTILNFVVVVKLSWVKLSFVVSLKCDLMMKYDKIAEWKFASNDNVICLICHLRWDGATVTDYKRQMHHAHLSENDFLELAQTH